MLRGGRLASSLQALPPFARPPRPIPTVGAPGVTDKELAARIRMLRRLGVSEFEVTPTGGMRLVLAARERQHRLPKAPAEVPPPDDDAADLAGHPSAYWAAYQQRKVDQAREGGQ